MYVTIFYLVLNTVRNPVEVERGYRAVSVLQGPHGIIDYAAVENPTDSKASEKELGSEGSAVILMCHMAG